MSLRIQRRRLSGLKRRTNYSFVTASWVLFQAAFIFALQGCHPRPTEDLALADVAVKAAQKAKAESLATDYFRKAENFYLRAKKDYADGYYDSAKKYAEDARKMAEQAEYQALKKQTEIKGKPDDEVLTPSHEGRQ